MAKAPKGAVRGAGRVAFLARRDDIQKLLDAGHTLRAIYKMHGAGLNISYSQFARYVSRYIRPPANVARPVPTSVSAPPPPDIPPPEKEPEAPSPSPAKPKGGGFSFDPNRGNNLDDLV